MTGDYTRANMLAWLRAYLDDLSTLENDLPRGQATGWSSDHA
jgi:hypothetical protein